MIASYFSTSIGVTSVSYATLYSQCSTIMTLLETLFKESTYRPNPDNENVLEITYDYNAAEALIHIERLVQAIITNKDDLLFTVEDHGNGVKHVTETDLAKAITFTLAHCTDWAADHFPIHEFNPYIHVFFRNIGTGELIEIVRFHEELKKNSALYHGGVDYDLFMKMSTGIIALVTKIRLDIQSRWFKDLITNARRSSKKNSKSLLEYIKSLFDHHARLLVVRLDLSYHMGNVIRTEDDIPVKYQEAKGDFTRFLNNIDSNSLFRNMLGYVWKLEYGAEKGFHYHVMLFFNGSNEDKDERLARRIGEYWQCLTNYRGIYYNCNANKSSYRCLGIGMIKYNDSNLLKNLNTAAVYLIKTDYYARALVPGNDRTFGRGEKLQPKDTNRGRPRLIDPETVF